MVLLLLLGVSVIRGRAVMVVVLLLGVLVLIRGREWRCASSG